MSVKNENAAGGESVVLESPAAGGVYASLFEKINLNPVSELSALDMAFSEPVRTPEGPVCRIAGTTTFTACAGRSGSVTSATAATPVSHYTNGAADCPTGQIAS